MAFRPLEQELEGLGKFSLMHPDLAHVGDVWLGKEGEKACFVSPTSCLRSFSGFDFLGLCSVCFCSILHERKSGKSRDIHSAETTASRPLCPPLFVQSCPVISLLQGIGDPRSPAYPPPAFLAFSGFSLILHAFFSFFEKN